MTAIMLVVTILFMNGGALGLEVMAHIMGYENRLFDHTKVHTVDIVMNDWDEFIDNAASEEYYAAAVVIDGEAYKNVGIRGKGNTSLSTVSSMNSERYSFKVEFDHYDSSITYHGLDKLSLNNLIQDSTMMKDYLTYTMMAEFGAAAPLCSFVYITVNGEDWGLYLAVEGVEDSFLERNYGSDYGELYKPDSMSFGGGRGNGKDFNMDDFMNREESGNGEEAAGGNSFDPSTMFGGEMPDMGNFDFSQMPGAEQGEADSESRGGFSFGGMGGFGMGSSDVKLQYIDDNLSSYSNIWNNAKTDITEADQVRLIESLKKLSAGEDIESVVDVERVIRYFVVHNYVCNGDSYTGSMIHNYYLYEEDGQLAMLPWDYNLAFGTFQGGSGQSTVNTPIDAPVSGGSGEDRPMWSWILSDESYTEQYHQYFAEFLNKVDVQAIIDSAYDLIGPYVEKDPTAFYTYEEFETGVETMRQFCLLRSESISMQLANGETTSNMGYADASGLMLSDMGSMGGMGGFGGMGDRGNFSRRDSLDDQEAVVPDTDGETSSDANAPEATAFPSQDLPQNGGQMPDGLSGQMPDGFGGQTPDGFSGQMPDGFSGQMPDGFSGQMPDGFSGQISAEFGASQISGGHSGFVSLSSGSEGNAGGFDFSQMPGGFGGDMPEGFDPSQMPDGFGGQMPGGFGGDMPEGFDPSQMPDGFAGSFPGWPSGETQDGSDQPDNPGDGTASGQAAGETSAPDASETGDSADDTGDMATGDSVSNAASVDASGSAENAGSARAGSRSSWGNMQMPGGSFSFDMSGMGNAASDSTGWMWIAISALVLGAGLIIAGRYRY